MCPGASQEPPSLGAGACEAPCSPVPAGCCGLGWARCCWRGWQAGDWGPRLPPRLLYSGFGCHDGPAPRGFGATTLVPALRRASCPSRLADPGCRSACARRALLSERASPPRASPGRAGPLVLSAACGAGIPSGGNPRSLPDVGWSGGDFLAREGTPCLLVGGKPRRGEERAERGGARCSEGGREGWRSGMATAQEGTQRPVNDRRFLLCFLPMLEAFLNKNNHLPASQFPSVPQGVLISLQSLSP